MHSVLFVIHFPQEVYISKVKAVLGKELCFDTTLFVDDVKQNVKKNGSPNGSHKNEDIADVTMDVEDETETVKSPGSSKGKGGRKSKANSDTKS